MMAVKFKQSQNELVTKNKDGWIESIPVAFTRNNQVISFWKFNKEELEEAQKSGGVFVVADSPLFRFNVQVDDPFYVPREFHVGPDMQVFVTFVDDEELFFLHVQPGEHSFEVEQMEEEGEPMWMVRCWMQGYQGLMMTDYIFGEEVKIKGLASDFYGSYNEALAGRDPLTTLILERVNKTKKFYEE